MRPTAMEESEYNPLPRVCAALVVFLMFCGACCLPVFHLHVSVFVGQGTDTSKLEPHYAPILLWHSLQPAAPYPIIVVGLLGWWSLLAFVRGIFALLWNDTSRVFACGLLAFVLSFVGSIFVGVLFFGINIISSLTFPFATIEQFYLSAGFYLWFLSTIALMMSGVFCENPYRSVRRVKSSDSES